jgi:class 3 adenylate cyclase
VKAATMHAVPLAPALAEVALSRVRAFAYALVLPALALIAPRAGLSRGALALVLLTALTCALSAWVPALRSWRGRALPRATGTIAPFVDLAALTGLHLLLARALPELEPGVLLSFVASAVLVLGTTGLRGSALLAAGATLASFAGLAVYLRLHPGAYRPACALALLLGGGLALLIAGVLRRAAAQEGLRRFLSPSGVLRAEADPALLAAGGARREATVLFAELRGIAAFTNEREPEEVIRLLRRLRALLVAAVQEENGTLLELTGDGVLAVFGAPESSPGDARAALHAAAGIVRHVRALAISEDVAVGVGVGLHRGRVVAGDVGTDGALAYALAGDVAGIARRLESLTHEVKVEVILSGDVSAALDASASLRPLGPIRVLGRGRTVEAFAWEEAPSDPGASLLSAPR